MRYIEHFKGYVLVKLYWEDGSDDHGRYVEGRIVDETKELIFLENVIMYTPGGTLSECKELIINKEYIDYIDSTKKGNILELAKKKYHREILNVDGILLTLMFSSIPFIIIIGNLFT